MLAKAIVFFILHIFFIPLVHAQQDTLHPVCKLLNLSNNWDFGAGARFSFLDFEEINRSLEAAGLPGLESPLSCLDMSVRTTCSWKHLAMETGVRYSFGASKKNNFENRQSVTFRDYTLQSRLMFDVFRSNKMSKIFPFAGLGVSYQVLKTYPAASDFGNSSASATANRNRRFNYIPVSFETGLSLEQGMKLFGKHIFFGIRSGYAFRFFQTDWSLDEGYTVDLPKPAASSPFVAMTLRVKTPPKQVCIPYSPR